MLQALIQFLKKNHQMNLDNKIIREWSNVGEILFSRWNNEADCACLRETETIQYQAKEN